jgi:hypothetical protein
MPWPHLKTLLAGDDDNGLTQDEILEHATMAIAREQCEAFDELCFMWRCEPAALRMKTLDELADGLHKIRPAGRPNAALLAEPLKNYLDQSGKTA